MSPVPKILTLWMNFLLIIIPITKTSDIICEKDVNCMIDCSADKYDCKSADIINARNASSLTLLCNILQACSTSNILTPDSPDSITIIECSSIASCTPGVRIYYYGDATSTPSTHFIDLNCTYEDACGGITIFADQAGQLTIDCGHESNCSPFEIYAENVDIINIICKGSETVFGCSGFEINANNANSLYIYASFWGMMSSDIFGKNISNIFQITAIGYGIYWGIYDMYIYIPDSDKNFYLGCYGTGCNDTWGGIRFEKDNDFSNIGQANIKFNGCLQCEQDGSNCLRTIDTVCNDGTNTDSFEYFDEWNCGYPQNETKCSCNTFAKLFQDSYYDDPSDMNCILPDDIIECGQGSNCQIDCNTENCRNNTIVGSRANSLIINCNSINSCKNTKIYPTILPLTNTSIICTDINSCNGDFIIYGTKASSLNIISNAFGLNGGNIYIENITNSFNLKCIGNGTNNGACIGNTNIYLPIFDDDLHKISIDCIGSGCQEINFIKPNGFNNIGDINIKFSGCNQCGNNVTSCINRIGTICNKSNNTYFPLSPVNTGCASSNNCNCDVFSSEFENAFIRGCITQLPTTNPTNMPTIQPTTYSPTTDLPTTTAPTTGLPTTVSPTQSQGAASQDGDDGAGNDNNLGVTIGIIIGCLIVIILIIIGVIYWYKKNQADKDSVETNTANYS